jgi:hypothetical protein
MAKVLTSEQASQIFDEVASLIVRLFETAFPIQFSPSRKAAMNSLK